MDVLHTFVYISHYYVQTYPVIVVSLLETEERRERKFLGSNVFLKEKAEFLDVPNFLKLIKQWFPSTILEL